MNYHYFIFTDEGFTARVLVTRPGVTFRMDVWASDVTAFHSTEPALDAWFAGIVKDVRDTQHPVFVNVTSPTGFRRYFLPPSGPTKNTNKHV